MLISSISALLIYAAWARGGTVQSLQLPLPIIAGVLLLALAFKRGGLKRLLCDPVTWIGLLFLGLLTVQWWNAGRVHFFDPFLGEWGYTAPRIDWLPAAFTRAEAAEMLRWFFPAWALLAAIRAGDLGFRYLLPYELPDDDWEWVVGSFGNYGKANVHNDFLQFLAEFGLVGFGLMLTVVGLLIAPVSHRRDLGPLTSMALTGTLLVAVHSLVDLPFRSPGVLYAWLAVLACAPLVGTVNGER